MLNIARVFIGTPVAAALGRLKRLAVDQTRSLRVHLSQALDHSTSSIEGWEKPATDMAGQGTVDCLNANTAYQLTAADTPCIGVYLTAVKANAGICIFGSAGVTTAGAAIPKVTDSGPVYVPVENANLIYVASSNAGDDVEWSAISR